MSDTPAHDVLISLLDGYRDPLGADHAGYLNHCRRMLTFCLTLQPTVTSEQREKLAIAAAFHDIGLWTDDTLDYLPPSAVLAAAYLRETGREDWVEEVCLMVTEHHKLRPFNDPRYPLVEVFRRADLVDFSLGIYRAGLSREFIAGVKARVPNAGFHAMLMRRSLRWLKQHPFNPAPMMKW